ncbi:hypothetical protein [Chitinophaga arvensicola]|uniref:Carboxypeptidase regulatory-like domain-containing protein n=1 Tax=Chitinophaga arvensicola TaxID=29529 RepID=A0A1I0PWD8_9BACT|nr:hypothetical protein [Chitinophaga arvensicola]SEW18702.1 hypothetical protein SAMN04488122_1036 [Chitinophaga arvensicola]
MKKNILTVLFLSAFTTATAQNPVTVAVGGGISTTSSGLKTNAFLGDGYHIQTQVFVPFLRKGWDGSIKGSGKFALGVIAGGEYATAKSLTPDENDLKSSYRLYNDALNITTQQQGTSHSYSGFAGLQADITLGGVTISPAMSGGYFSLSQKGFTQNSMVASNGTTESVTLRNLSSSNSNGFITIPQLKISYALSPHFSVYAAGAIHLGPVITTTQNYLKPAGGFNEKSTYESMQLTTGKMVEKGSESRYQQANVSIGASWSFGSSRRLKGKVTKPGDNGLKNTVDEPAGKSISEKGVSSTKSRRNEISIAENPGGEPAGKSISTKGVSSTKSKRNENNMVAGTPIGGIVVKGGKNPGGNMITAITNDKGQLELNNLEAGDYVFTITAPEQPAGKSISEKGVSSTKSRRNESNMAAGSPIGGIVVKGGKNPGGNMLLINTDDKGTFSFTASEAGNYLFTVLRP